MIRVIKVILTGRSFMYSSSFLCTALALVLFIFDMADLPCCCINFIHAIIRCVFRANRSIIDRHTR